MIENNYQILKTKAIALMKLNNHYSEASAKIAKGKLGAAHFKRFRNGPQWWVWAGPAVCDWLKIKLSKGPVREIDIKHEARANYDWESELIEEARLAIKAYKLSGYWHDPAVDSDEDIPEMIAGIGFLNSREITVEFSTPDKEGGPLRELSDDTIPTPVDEDDYWLD